MRKIDGFFICLVILIVGLTLGACTTATGSATPTATARVVLPTSANFEVRVKKTLPATRDALTTREKERVILGFLVSLIENPKYDPDSDVLHKYLNMLDIRLDGTTLTFTVQSRPDTARELLKLGSSLIIASAVVSQAGEPGDWRLTRIEVISPGAPGDPATVLYVTSHTYLALMAQGKVGIYDIIRIEYVPRSVGS